MVGLGIFRTYLKTPFAILLVLEILIIFGSVFSAALFRFYYQNPNFGEIVTLTWVEAISIALLTSLSMLAMGLYQGQIREGIAGVLLRITISFIGAGILISLIFYLFPGIFLGRGILALAYAQSFFVIGTLRILFFEIVDSSLFKNRILVYGADNTASQIDLKLRRKSDRRGFNIVGYVLLEGQKREVTPNQIVKVNSSLLDYAIENKIDEIVVATSEMKQQIAVDDLVDCKLNGILVIDILSFFEREAGQIRIDIMDPSWLVTADGFRQSRTRDITKRFFDILVSVLILVVMAPVLVLTMIAIMLEDGFRAPVFYSQIRVGSRGKPYRLYKFRSMRCDAEKSGEAVWASESDDRITRVGRFIRKTRLDEFPQILNVLNGTMSFVGPRPERPQFVEQLKNVIPYYKERHLVKPGVTGWAQLLYPYGSSVNDAYQKQLFDMYYVKNHSIFLDCLILLQTVEVILLGKGAR